MEQIRTGVENLYRKIENLDLEGLVGGWRGVARDLSAVLASGDMQATLADIRESAARLKEIATGLARPDNRHALNAGIEDMAAAAASAKAAGKALKTRLDSIPPDALANIAERADRAVTTGETAVTSLNRQVDQSLLLLQQSVFEINQLLSELKRLVQSLQEEPGRILVRPKGAEPFRR